MSPLVLCITLGAVALGCADDEEPGKPDTACLVPGQCSDDGADEVGDGDGDDELFCTVHEGYGKRTVHQCNGHLTATIEFETLKGNCGKTLGDDAWCYESHSFGVDDEPYEMPAVMACCDAGETPEDELLRFCAMDLVEQVCRSVPLRINALIKQGAVKGVEAQAKSLLLWLNQKESQQACYDTLHKPSDSPGIIGPASWKVNGGVNKNWPLLKSFTVKLNHAVVESVSLPDDEADYLDCVDVTINNAEVFEEWGPIAPTHNVDVYSLGDSFNVSIMGPSLPDGGRVHGLAKAASQSLCAEPWCSSLVIGEDGGLVVLEDLELFADGAATVTMGEMPLAVDRLTLRLYGVRQAQPYHGNDGDAYILEPGTAHFLVSGAVGTLTGTRWVSNATPIRLQPSEGGWNIGGFNLVHTDGLGGTWEVALPPTTWN